MAQNIKKDYQQQRKNYASVSQQRKQAPTNDLRMGKVPPQANEAEASVLGALMLERDKIDMVRDILPEPECFYSESNRRIYEAILDMHTYRIPIDLVSLTDKLRKAGDLEIVGGAYYLTNLTLNIVTGAHVEHHAYLVKEKYMARELIRISGMAISNAYEDSDDIFDLLNVIESELFRLNESAINKEPLHVGKVAREVTKEVTRMREEQIEFTGVPTGLESLDNVTGGWQPGHLIVLAARPAVGKTALALSFAMNAATNTNSLLPVGLFSLEMGAGELVKRMQSAIANILLRNILLPIRMQESEYNEYLTTEATLQKTPIYIDDTAGLTVMELRAKARRLRNKHKIKLIIIDYLQLMKGSKGGNREQEVAQISRELKELAKELEIPIIALSQLNRSVESRKDNKPNMSDIRESGAIEQDADLIMMLYGASEEEQKKDPSMVGYINLDIKKNRHGRTEDLLFYFDKEHQKWYEKKPATISATETFPEPTNHYRSFGHLTPGHKKEESLGDLPF